MSAIGSKNKLNILNIGNKIAYLANQSNLLTPYFHVHFNIQMDQTNKSLLATFSLNEETYSKAVYFIEYQPPKAGYLAASGAGVNSDIGSRTGTFLFHLQLLLVMLSGAQTFYLDNYTDDPARAAQGIYSLLDVNQTKRDTTLDRSEFSRSAFESSLPHNPYDLLSHRLTLSEGQMRLIVDANSLSKWVAKMNELSSKLQSGVNSPWNENSINNMNRFISFLSQTYSGGKKTRKYRKGKLRKSRKSKKKKKRSKNIKIKC